MMKKLLIYISSSVSGMLFSVVPLLADTSPIDSSLANSPGVNLTIQSLYGIIQGLACYASDLILVVMVAMIIWYGFQMMLAGDNPTNFTSARKALGYAVVGMIVILGAYTIIATVGNAIAGIGTGSVWTFIPLQCSLYSLH